MAGVGFRLLETVVSEIRIMTLLQVGQMGKRDLNASKVEVGSGAHPMDRRLFPWG
jgi:hypothetical protein